MTSIILSDLVLEEVPVPELRWISKTARVGLAIRGGLTGLGEDLLSSAYLRGRGGWLIGLPHLLFDFWRVWDFFASFGAEFRACESSAAGFGVAGSGSLPVFAFSF